MASASGPSLAPLDEAHATHRVRLLLLLLQGLLLQGLLLLAQRLLLHSLLLRAHRLLLQGLRLAGGGHAGLLGTHLVLVLARGQERRRPCTDCCCTPAGALQLRLPNPCITFLLQEVAAPSASPEYSSTQQGFRKVVQE